MEYIPHNYLCQTLFLDKLSRGVIHRTVNRCCLFDPLEVVLLLKGANIKWTRRSNGGLGCGKRSPSTIEKKEISHNNDTVACRAICTLNELVHHPELAVEAIRIRIVPRFVKTLKSDNIIIMQRSLLCIKHICMQPMGVASVIENTFIIESIRDCIRNPVSAVIRCQASRTVNALVHNYFAVRTLAQAGYVKEIMKCVNETKGFDMNVPVPFPSIIEMKDLLVYHLDSLLRLLDDGDEAKVALMSEGVFELSSFLTGPCMRLKKVVASLFVELAKHPIGKDGIVAHELVPVLCEGVAYAHTTEMKTKMAAILQFATIHKEGRKQAFNYNLINILVKYLPVSNVPLELKRYALNTLTNLAELPEGRQILRDALSKTRITVIVQCKNEESIQRSIKQLYKVINWEP